MTSGGGSGSIDDGPIVEPGDPGTSDVVFEIRTDSERHAISPLIYGLNGCPDAQSNRPLVCRSGGNRMTAYNWENNASNAGSDYLFQNDSFLSDSDTPGAAVKGLIDTARQQTLTALLTVPIVDYVAADKDGGGDVRDSGSDYLSTRFKQNRSTKGAPLSATPDTTDDYVYQDEFVSWVMSQAGTTPVIFSLDNEPDLWAYTHAEIHPDPVTYQELVDRNTEYASAIKAVWPEAEVTGFVSYGWYGYLTLQDAPDAEGRDFLDFYLDQMAAAQATAGKRLIDYLDLHWYSEATGNGVRINDGGNRDALTTAPVVEARLQAPRSLWDPNYSETSWIVDGLGEPIRLIPRLLEKIEAHYPGTKLAFTEWDYGAGWDISGGIAFADTLGIFGREGVALATYWPLDSDESFAMAALRAFRNYDGQGGSFGDTSVHASTSDVERTSIYASIDAEEPARMVLVAINKDPSVVSAGITVAHSTVYARANVFTLSEGGGARLASAAALETVATNAFNYAMPARSVSVIELVPNNP